MPQSSYNIPIIICVEKKRQVMLSDMSEMTKSIEKVKLEVAKEEKVLDKLKASIHQTR